VIKDLNHITLINDCLKGNQVAFKTLYNSYKGYVYTICVRYGVSNIEIKDQMQIIFNEIFKSLKNYDSKKSKFKTWLSRITINQILLQRRKKNIETTSLYDDSNNLVHEIYGIKNEDEIDFEAIKKVLSKMPQKYIVAFNMFIIDGFTHKEISQHLSIPETTSRTLVHRGRVWAMKTLKEKLSLESEENLAIKRK